MTWKDRKKEFMENNELKKVGDTATKISKELKRMSDESSHWKGGTLSNPSDSEDRFPISGQVDKESKKMPEFGLQTSAEKIKIVFAEVQEMLLQKNEQYGDSALSPNRIFSKASTDEQLKVRIDDKLNRLILGNDSMESDDDVIRDLIGYFVLLLVSQRG
tara:strand:+ start:107 stop:586 length:480 start_codon:yes stop_codon:yes gene_type:complete